MRLFAERGYQATTVEQIAAAAEVSPSTFFRAWYTAGDHASPKDYLAVMDASLAHLEAGLPL